MAAQAATATHCKVVMMAPENPQHTVEARVTAKRLVGGMLVTDTRMVFKTKRVVYTIRVLNT